MVPEAWLTQAAIMSSRIACEGCLVVWSMSPSYGRLARIDRARLQLPHAVVQHEGMRDGIAWEDLRFVLAVARAGNLRRGAGTLGVDATTVGRRIAAIDSRVGYALFERS